MLTKKITIRGLVQGIGYRPFVAETAERCSVTGWVRNTNGIVTILVSGSFQNIGQFLGSLKTSQPEGARVDEIICEDVPVQEFRVFSIIESEEQKNVSDLPFIPADLPTCEDCVRELHDQGNRRYRHPFISCTACGPRYSIIEKLPYDRENISMKKFPLCEACSFEYQKPGDVRRHAQTIACPDCGPKLMYSQIWPAITDTEADDRCTDRQLKKNNRRQDSIGNQALTEALRCLKEGGIVAVKDIGGYHLACTPFSEETVQQLRRLKGREKKPFAVMFPDLEAIKDFCEINTAEEKLLFSAPRPIVLLHKKKDGKHLAENVCGSSPDIGAMLPCNPVQILLTEELGPLIMTSANASGELLILENQKMMDWMEQRKNVCGIPLGILSHDRPILTPLDDSVVRIVSGRTQIFRRARGYVPNPVSLAVNHPIFAAGGDLKASFCYTGCGRAYMSQYLGDLEEEECFLAYQKEMERMQKLFGFSPTYFACDLHPGYWSGKSLKNGNIPKLYHIQHHEAHAASVIAEHDLTGQILCFAFDGTGYGRDRTIWGSEAFIWNGSRMERFAHLRPVCLIGGNEGAKNADTILYSYLASLPAETRSYPGAHPDLFPWFDDQQCRIVEKAIQCRINTVESSSMGRLFDAVSAILDICHYNSYEGESAIELENLAVTAGSGYPLHIKGSVGDRMEFLGDTEPLFRGIIEAIKRGVPKGEIARGFLTAVSDFICEICEQAETVVENAESRKNVKQIALSGGTFQNRILLEQTICHLEEKGYLVYINEQVPPGDGGICLGQAYLCEKEIELQNRRNGGSKEV